MSFVPRSVVMGNKVYKIHVKCEGGKDTFSVPPDYSVGQLKTRIAAKFNVPASQLVLLCNGRALQGEDHCTLRQARVFSGSKIMAIRPGGNESVARPGKLNSLDREEKARREEIREKVYARDGEQQLGDRINEVQRQAEELEERVTILGKQTDEDPNLRRKQSRIAGEECMRLLETLDNIALDPNMEQLRSQRKMIARNLNAVMDRNDSIIENITDLINNTNA